jgi:hypothetical protein
MGGVDQHAAIFPWLRLIVRSWYLMELCGKDVGALIERILDA